MSEPNIKSPATADAFHERCLRHDKELRSRVKLLGTILGDVIRGW